MGAFRWIWVLLGLWPSPCVAQQPVASAGSVRVAIVKMPYVGERNVAELSRGPDDLLRDREGLAMKAAYELIRAALRGVQQRSRADQSSR